MHKDYDSHYFYGEIDKNNIAKAIRFIIDSNNNIGNKNHLNLIINSEGGDVYESLALIDVMRSSNIPVNTYAIGKAQSAATLYFPLIRIYSAAD